MQVRNTSVREYPMGRTASHMVGWVGQVDAGPQLDAAERSDAYGPNDMAGQTGLEVAVRAVAAGRRRGCSATS